MAAPAGVFRRPSIRAPAIRSLADLLTAAERRPQFEMAHHIVLPAPPDRAFSVTDSFRLGEIAVIRWLFRLRGLVRPGTTREAMNGLGFPTQRDEPGRELSFLGAGRLWSRRLLFDPLPAEELARAGEIAAPRCAIAIWAAYRLEPLGPGSTRLTQVTRVRASGRVSWALFAGYWIATRPLLALIRVVLLRAVRRRCGEGPESTALPTAD